MKNLEGLLIPIHTLSQEDQFPFINLRTTPGERKKKKNIFTVHHHVVGKERLNYN